VAASLNAADEVAMAKAKQMSRMPPGLLDSHERAVYVYTRLAEAKSLDPKLVAPADLHLYRQARSTLNKMKKLKIKIPESPEDVLKWWQKENGAEDLTLQNFYGFIEELHSELKTPGVSTQLQVDVALIPLQSPGSN
jgi:hypothetical protein